LASNRVETALRLIRRAAAAKVAAAADALWTALAELNAGRLHGCDMPSVVNGDLDALAGNLPGIL